MNIGLVGYGVMGKNHERIVLSDNDHELIGIFDPRFSRSDGTLFKDKLTELIAAGMEACILSVPPNMTRLSAEMLAANKIPTLIEKPLSDNYSDALRIIKYFEETDTYAAVGYVERFNQAVIKAKELLDAGELGRILEISSIRLGYLGGRSPEVGVELDLLVHDLDLIHFLTDKKLSQAKALRTSFFQTGISDSTTIIGLMGGEIHFTIRANWISPFKKREFSITGERGTLVINTLDMEVRLYKNGTVESYWDQLTSIRGFTQGDVINFALDRKEPLKSQFESFIVGSQGARVSSTSPTQAAELLRVIENLFMESA